MESQIPPATRISKKLPVIAIIMESLKLPLFHWQAVLRAAWPYIFMLYLEIAWDLFYRWAGTENEGAPKEQAKPFLGDAESYLWVIAPALDLIILLVAIWALVRCHRLFLLGSSDSPATGVWGIGREGRFGLKFVSIFLCLIPVAVLASTLLISVSGVREVDGVEAGSLETWLKQVSLWSISLLVTYVFSRFALALPATALDRRVTLLEAWRLSKANGWRILCVTTLLWLILDLALYPAFHTLTGLSEFWSSALAYNYYALIVFTPIDLYVSVAAVAALSLAYRTLGEERTEADLPVRVEV